MSSIDAVLSHLAARIVYFNVLCKYKSENKTQQP